MAYRLTSFRYSEAEINKTLEVLDLRPGTQEAENILRRLQSAAEHVLFQYYLAPRKDKKSASGHGKRIQTLLDQLEKALDDAFAVGNCVEIAAETDLQQQDILSEEADIRDVLNSLRHEARQPYEPKSEHDIHRPDFLKKALDILEEQTGRPAATTRDGQASSFICAVWNPIRDFARNVAEFCTDIEKADSLRKAKKINDGASAEKLIQALRKIPKR